MILCFRGLFTFHYDLLLSNIKYKFANINNIYFSNQTFVINAMSLLSFSRTRPKVQFNGYVGHESSNGQASFENPMYDTNMKPTEAKAVRFDTTLNTVCTVV